MSSYYDPNANQPNNQWGGSQYGGGSSYGQMNYAQWIDRVLAALIDGALGGVLAVVLMGVLFVLVLILGVAGAGMSQVSEDGGSLVGGLGGCPFAPGASVS